MNKLKKLTNLFVSDLLKTPGKLTIDNNTIINTILKYYFLLL